MLERIKPSNMCHFRESINFFHFIHIKLLLRFKEISGLRGAEEVDEAEDYEAPGSNPGQEL